MRKGAREHTMACTLKLMSAHRALRAIFTRSAREESAPCAQHEPQYWGMCWLRSFVQ